MRKLRRNATEVQNNMRDFKQKIEDCRNRQRYVIAIQSERVNVGVGVNE